MKSVSLYQLDNAGFAIKKPDSLWMVDALHQGYKQYNSTGPEALALIRRLAGETRPPVRLIITHLHPDHAGEEAIRAFAGSTPLAVYSADPEIRDWNLGGAELHLLPLDENFMIGGNSVRAIPVPHVSPERFNILHTALRLDVGGVSIFVSGDALTDARLFERSAPYIAGADAAVCLYAYAFTRRNLEFTGTYIRPRRLVVNHFPAPERDSFNTLARFADYTQKESLTMPVIPFVRVGDRLDL